MPTTFLSQLFSAVFRREIADTDWAPYDRPGAEPVMRRWRAGEIEYRPMTPDEADEHLSRSAW